eukprot:CAMPEP_0203912526 /NCGR_PEP_ID=MMETSP0359-20131031/53598_1 /ASSEMBLY_ACC=CAM_ASM_000338 /TAXON_ID=268821 /ORGANISM="Scrippsiella Hangoei, Strain SHTV-5" /LENGTH=40 /DNA_ID= /DNA_START= /DNA_END= /DNA_ORIENTATION=
MGATSGGKDENNHQMRSISQNKHAGLNDGASWTTPTPSNT